VAYETIRALIWGKTYPELSFRHVETVCTAAVREDGRPIRLYPVPLRYLDGSKQYALYDWIEVPVEKSTSDPRPESYKVVSDAIRVVAHVYTDDRWRHRRDHVFRDATWQFDSVAALKAAQRSDGRSMGIVSVGRVESVSVEMRPPQEEAEFREKWKDIEAQGQLFHPQYKQLEYLPYRIRLAWRCAGTCEECASSPHDMGVLDWGLLELARKTRDPENAASRLREITNRQEHDFKLFMGSFRLRPYQFGIIGLWYPKLADQLDLLDSP
jgi:hypothetical protein